MATPTVERDDAFSRLRAANPVEDVLGLPGPASMRGVQLLERILRTPPDEVPPLRRRRGWRGPAIGVVVLAAIGLAAAAWLRQPDVTIQVACHEGASPDSSAVVVAAEGDAVEACAELWSAGELPLAPGAPGEVPGLVACTLEGGALAVLPAGSCAEVGDEGLPAPPDQAPDAAVTLAEVVEDLRAVVTSDPCPDPAATLDAWRDVLAGAALDGWSVEGDPTAVGCAGLEVDEPERVVRMVVSSPPEVGSEATDDEVLQQLGQALEGRCLPTEALRDEVHAVLDGTGATSWVVELLDEPATGTCARYVVDPDSRTVVVLPGADG